ncbi:unnamed protein product [Clavelina lepadiformis]|uniref:Frizzled-4 n=1 Tax=Clavelina lepadiformis TaxID=159417 RepID=A0ABP0FVE0_CLALP
MLLLILNLVMISSGMPQQGRHHHRQCVPITEKICAGFEYNMTTMPNILGHESQAEASASINEFQLLLETKCSDRLQFFLCSLYFPMCSSKVDVAITACRPMCEEVRSKCEPVMQKAHFEWPSTIDCNKLPIQTEKQKLCMQPPNITKSVTSVSLENNSKDPASNVPVNSDDKSKQRNEESLNPCQNFNKFYFDTRSKACVPRCDAKVDVMFNHDDKRLAYFIFFVCGLFCFSSTAVTMLTFLIDNKRFKYPLKPILFMALCYNAYSAAYLFRSTKGPIYSMSCADNNETSSQYMTSGFDNTTCTAVFVVLYYFGMAASAWWVVLSLTWFLSAGFKWSHEAISGFGFYFHIFAWSLPAVQTVVVMFLGKTDGDEFTGMCYIGNHDPDMQLYAVILPSAFYLLTGSLILSFGFSSLLKIRQMLKQQDSLGNFEKLLLKLGLFSFFYVIPAACLLVINFYQYQNYPFWILHSQTKHCSEVTEPKPKYVNSFEHRSIFAITNNKQDHLLENVILEASNKYSNVKSGFTEARKAETLLNCSIKESIPPFSAFVTKVLMPFLAGVATGIWVWSKKTINSWRHLFQTCRCTSRIKQQTNKQPKPAFTAPLLDNSGATSSEKSGRRCKCGCEVNEEHVKHSLPPQSRNSIRTTNLIFSHN